MTLAIYDAKGTTTSVGVAAIDQVLSSDSAGDIGVTVDSAGNLFAFHADGSSVPVPTGMAMTAMVTRDGGSLLWIGQSSPSDTAGPLFSAPVGSSTSKKIADEKVVHIDPLTYGSPRPSKYAVFATTYDPRSGASDLNYVPSDGSAPPDKVTVDDVSAIYGDATTFDDAFAMVVESVGSGTGDLHTFEFSTSADKRLSTGVWLAFSPKGHVVAYNDNWNSGGNGNEGVADLRIGDATGGATTLIATQAENNFYLTLDFAKIVFASSDPSIGKHGVYLYAVP
jgi:hypothetical protein